VPITIVSFSLLATVFLPSISNFAITVSCVLKLSNRLLEFLMSMLH
jgi:hypothetical protein